MQPSEPFFDLGLTIHEKTNEHDQKFGILLLPTAASNQLRGTMPSPATAIAKKGRQYCYRFTLGNFVDY